MDLYVSGSRKGEIRSNGDVYKDGRRIGEARNLSNVGWVAAVYFFAFFDFAN